MLSQSARKKRHEVLAMAGYSATVAQHLGGEEFLAFYLTAGMVSALVNYAGRLRGLSGGHFKGAYGALWACIAAFGTLYPGMLHYMYIHCSSLHSRDRGTHAFELEGFQLRGRLSPTIEHPN